MRVTVVGTGYVGLTTGVALAYLGHEVTCIDKNPAVVESLREGRPPFHEPGLPELLRATYRSMQFGTQLTLRRPGPMSSSSASGRPPRPTETQICATWRRPPPRSPA